MLGQEQPDYSDGAWGKAAQWETPHDKDQKKSVDHQS